MGHVSPSPQLGIDKLEVVVSLLPGIPTLAAAGWVQGHLLLGPGHTFYLFSAAH